MLENVGLPDKSHIQPLDHLPIPSQFRDIPLRTTDLGAYATPDLARLMPLFSIVSLDFSALLSRRSHVRIVLGRPIKSSAMYINQSLAVISSL